MSDPNLSAEIDSLREAYAALNRGDIAGFVRGFDPQIARIELFSGRNFYGLADVTEHVSAGRGTWAEGGCEPRRFIVSGNRVIVFVDVRVRVKGETDWREGRTVDIYTFRNGLTTEFRTFADERQAMEWAGVKV